MSVLNLKMKSKNKLKEINIKNRASYYFDGIINGTVINFSNILLDKKIYENISGYDISYKTQQLQNHYVLSSIK